MHTLNMYVEGPSDLPTGTGIVLWLNVCSDISTPDGDPKFINVYICKAHVADMVTVLLIPKLGMRRLLRTLRTPEEMIANETPQDIISEGFTNRAIVTITRTTQYTYKITTAQKWYMSTDV